MSKLRSQKYTIKGQSGINTKKMSQATVLSMIRAIKGVTTVGFTPRNHESPAVVIDNTNYVGMFNITVDTFPFEQFNKEEEFKSIVNTVRSIAAINFFRVDMESLLEHGTL